MSLTLPGRYVVRGAGQNRTTRGTYELVKAPRLTGKYIVIPDTIAMLMGFKKGETEQIAIAMDESTNEIVLSTRILGVFLTAEEIWKAARQTGPVQMDMVETMESLLMRRVQWYTYTDTFRVYVKVLLDSKKTKPVADLVNGLPLQYRLYRYSKQTGLFAMCRIKLQAQSGVNDVILDRSGERPVEAVEGDNEEESPETVTSPVDSANPPNGEPLLGNETGAGKTDGQVAKYRVRNRTG